MQNDEARARKRIARYLQFQIRQLGVPTKVIAKDIGTSPDRIDKICLVTPQSHVLQRIGASIERYARLNGRTYKRAAGA